MDEQFGAALRAIRHERQLSQVDLATDLETTPRHISDWETGRVDPRVATVRRLAEALNCSAAVLLEERRDDSR